MRSRLVRTNQRQINSLHYRHTKKHNFPTPACRFLIGSKLSADLRQRGYSVRRRYYIIVGYCVYIISYLCATIICKRRLACLPFTSHLGATGNCLHHLAPLKAHSPKILGPCPGSELQEMNIVIATTNHQTVMNRCYLTARNRKES